MTRWLRCGTSWLFGIELSEHPKDLATLAGSLIEALECIYQKGSEVAKTSGGALDELTRRREARRGAWSQFLV